MTEDDRTLLLDRLYAHPQLHFLFLELTRRCNLQCRHCGSSCPEERSGRYLTLQELRPTLDEVAARFSPAQLMFCITGGEPLLSPEWERICRYIRSKGFSWGMTSNGTLIDAAMVRRLRRAGMRTVAISLDGLEQTHDAFRRVPGAFASACRALRLLKESGAFRVVQAVTVVSPLNLAELEALYQLLLRLGVDSWKLAFVEPIGEARKEPSLRLSKAQMLELLEFLRTKRQSAPIELTYCCSHQLPAPYDDTVRDMPFLCGAGTMIASITCEGDITACLDIDERERVVQGNIRRDSFCEVWEHGFRMFRRNKGADSPFCRNCARLESCRGEAWHTWDFAENRPRVCLCRTRGGEDLGAMPPEAFIDRCLAQIESKDHSF